MKVNIELEKNLNIKKQPQFKGAVDTSLRFLATNQGVGANLTDVSFMVIPRVATDAKRGPAACAETARREASGTANHSLIGVYGIGAGWLFAKAIEKDCGKGINNILAAPATLNILAENKATQIKNKTSQLDYLKETLSNLKAFNPTAKNADNDGFVKLKDSAVDEFAQILDDVINNSKWEDWNSKTSHNSKEVLINKITEKTGAQARYVLSSADGKVTSETELKTLLEDIFKLSKKFNEEKVNKAFIKQVESNASLKENVFINKLNKFMKARSIAGFILGTAIGMSIQPLNIYLTKLKTGSDGFVGVEGRSKDNSSQFKLMKLGASAGFFGLTLATLQTGFKGFIDKMAFKGFWPTIDQLKGIYGLTIISRLLAARDKDELRESLTKDFLGFLSWLVLGDLINKSVAEKLDSSVMNRTDSIAKQPFIKKIFNSKLKTRDEILIETLSKYNVSTVKEENGKIIAKNFKEMSEDLNKLPEYLKDKTKKRLSTLNKAQLAGYAFSGLVLGLGIPNLNIYITNTLDKKRKAKPQG